MTDPAANPATSSAISPDRVRHIWFPVAVVALAVAWWLRRSAATGYTTIAHVLVILISAALLSVWFVRCGGGRSACGNGSSAVAGWHSSRGWSC